MAGWENPFDNDFIIKNKTFPECKVIYRFSVKSTPPSA